MLLSGEHLRKDKTPCRYKERISKQTFRYTKEKPIIGSWQEATKSVVTWVLTSLVIQDIHCGEVPGATFERTDGKTKVNQSTVGFVDDNNNCVTKEDNRNKLEELLQTSAQNEKDFCSQLGACWSSENASPTQ